MPLPQGSRVVQYGTRYIKRITAHVDGSIEVSILTPTNYQTINYKEIYGR